jgi:hypothetical protein
MSRMRSRSPAVGSRRRLRPRIGALEDRRVPATFIVTTPAESGAGSLRQAILDSNGTAGPNTIAFHLDPQDATIRPASPLPAVTVPVTIDGTTQPGFDPSSPTIVVEIDGGATSSGDGLVISAGDSKVLGLAIVGFRGAGIHLMGVGGDEVRTDFVGLAPDGFSGLGNNLDGIRHYLTAYLPSRSVFPAIPPGSA